MLSILSYMRQGEYLLAIIAIFSRCFVVFCCMPIHEAAHAFVAYKLGDDTAKRQGRLTLNPLAHLNPLGTIMIFLFGIGYGQAVPVDERNFKNPKAGMALTALAGPVSNLLLGWISHGTQQHAVCGQALVQLVLGQRVAVLVNGLAAHGGSGVVEGMAVLFGHLIQHPEGLLYDLRAGAIAPDDSNIFFHEVLLLCSKRP